MSQALCFNEITFSPVNRHNSPWIRAVELSKALGFKREDQAAKIYRAHADEFTSDTAQVVEISDNADSAFPVKSLLFSLRGCHLLAMFARTPVAKQFRRWVLDVIEQYGDQVPVPPVENPGKLPSLSPSHRSELKGIVDAKLSTYPASVQGKARSEIWTRFNRHFRIAEYAQLPAERMAEAREYLIELEVKALKALPTAPSAVPGVEEDLAFIRACAREIMERERRMYFALRDTLPPLRGVTRPFTLRLHESMDAGSVLLDAALKQVESTARLVIEYGRG